MYFIKENHQDLRFYKMMTARTFSSDRYFFKYILQKESLLYLQTSYHFEMDISHMKEKVGAEGLSYIKFKVKKDSFFLVHL